MSQPNTEKEFFPMTKDVMFHGVFVRNKIALEGLVRSVLHLNEEDIAEIFLLSSSEPPDDVEGKDFTLDVKVALSTGSIVNLEMQVEPDEDWPNRSLSYLCRAYDNLNRGQTYDQIIPTIHIGFLCFSPFKNRRKFHSTYMLCDMDDRHVYSDKFILKVVQLKQTESATDEDIKFGVDRWARLFMATSRKELMMIAKDDPAMNEAVKTAILMNDDWETREAVIRYELKQQKTKHLEQKIDQLTATNNELTATNNVQAEEIERLKKLLSDANIDY